MKSAQTTASAATNVPTQNGTLKLWSSAVLWCTLPSPELFAIDSWIVSTIWMPATSPTCAASSCAALMTPYSDSASSFAIVDEVAGMDTPMPSPDRASATTTTMTADDAPSVAKITMESRSDTVPNNVALRSPVRTVMYPAIGAHTAKTRGRATDKNPTCDTLYP